jgi:ketosteroid isomerase-like protein
MEGSMKWLAGIAITASLIVIPASTYAENAPIDTKADVQKLAGQWMDAYNQKDAATIAKMYTDDAVVSFDQWTATGRAALQDALNKEFPADTKFTAITVDQSERVGDLNIARGTWAAEAKGPDGKIIPVNGHWLTVGMCQGQTCLISVHNGNTAMPPPK